LIVSKLDKAMKLRRSTSRILFALQISLCVIFGLALAGNARAQTGDHTEKGEGCRDDIAEADGFKFRAVKVKARYLPDLRHPLPQPGDPYSPVTVTTMVQDVSQALTDEAMRESVEGQTEHALLNTVTVGKGKLSDGFGFGIKFVTSCAKPVPPADCEKALGAGNPQCVDVAIHAFSVRINTADPISNLMNIPRSNRPSF
jgi:hypothetical protein